MKFQLTSIQRSAYISPKCFKTRLSSGMSPRQSVAFFTPIHFLWARWNGDTRPARGKPFARLDTSFEHRAHPIRFKTLEVDLNKSHLGAVMSSLNDVISKTSIIDFAEFKDKSKQIPKSQSMENANRIHQKNPTHEKLIYLFEKSSPAAKLWLLAKAVELADISTGESS